MKFFNDKYSAYVTHGEWYEDESFEHLLLEISVEDDPYADDDECVVVSIYDPSRGNTDEYSVIVEFEGSVPGRYSDYAVYDGVQIGQFGVDECVGVDAQAEQYLLGIYDVLMAHEQGLWVFGLTY